MPALLPHRVYVLVACLAAVLSFGASAQAKTTLRFGTLAPRNSTWGRVFDAFRRAMEQKSSGAVELRIFYNGILGSEASMAGKLRSGQIDGATLSVLGLAHFDQRVMVMTLPWLVNSWEKVDRVRADLAPQFEAELEKKGVDVLGWGDIGLIYGFTRGHAVRLPSDLRGHTPMVLRGEPVGAAFFENIPGVRPIPAEPMDVLNLLRSRRVDTISAPALVAEQLQWIPYLDHVSGQPLACAIGASVVRKATMDSLPPDVRTLFLDLSKKVGRTQSKRIRQLDLEAYERIKRRMTVVTVTDAERKEWQKIVTLVLKRLGSGVYPRPMMDRVAELTGHKIEW
ncbi:MAG TPA: TRAP transporter substrate-binding protein DctP [Polyangiaceae bacterium]|nr:TRAP transporter substrate-binding protein DctP [Polyangiaceae bacterium]